MLDFGIKDVIDILLVAFLLYYVYRLMKRSGTLSLFFGVLLFIALWVIASEMLGMRLTGTILDKFMSIGLIVLQRKVPLSDYEKTGDIIDAEVNTRLIENIFFKNSPLHDGAMIIADGRIKSVGCILPVSHDMDIPKSLGLRHRAALGMSQKTDAVCVIVSEETGNISVARDGALQVKVSAIDLEHILSE